MTARIWLARHGFDTERLSFGLRTALASCVALFVAWRLGLEHPQWSAMTVWAASQPVRGQLVEKSFFRAAGTLVGTAFGVLLMFFAGDRTLVLVIGLTIWVALCSGAGNALRGFVSYGALLAGYSASMVALLATANPGGILDLALDRLLTVMTGVVVALMVGLLLSRRDADDDIAPRVRRVLALLLQHMAARLGPQRKAPSTELDALLVEIAAIEERVDAHGAGSVRSRHSARSIRAALTAQVGAILWLKHAASTRGSDEAVAAALDDATLALDAAAPLGDVLAALDRARALASADPALFDVVRRIAEAVEERRRFLERAGNGRQPKFASEIVLHRDWVYASQTMLRTAVMLLLVGLAWVVTGWDAGAYVLLGTSVMVTLFSTFENPAWIMGRILLWQTVGAAAALACRWLVWPAAQSELQMVAMMVPFILSIVLPFAHQALTVGSIDYIMVLLLLLQPAHPLHGSFSASVATALAVVAGPLLAYIAFRLLFPTDARGRLERLKTMMIDELRGLSRDRAAPAKRHVWRARLHHRVMKLVHWANKTGEPVRDAVHGSLAVLDVGNAILELQALLHDPALAPRETDAIRATLRRIDGIRSDPAAAAGAFGRLARLLERRNRTVVAQLRHAAHGLSANLRFFGRRTIPLPGAAAEVQMR